MNKSFFKEIIKRTYIITFKNYWVFLYHHLRHQLNFWEQWHLFLIWLTQIHSVWLFHLIISQLLSLSYSLLQSRQKVFSSCRSTSKNRGYLLLPSVTSLLLVASQDYPLFWLWMPYFFIPFLEVRSIFINFLVLPEFLWAWVTF